jgi:acyl dehydratase
MRVFTVPDELLSAIGEHLGSSGYQQIDQSQIDLFAKLTGDVQWIHTDPVRATGGPFGSTIAHGFFTLSLLTSMLNEIFAVQGIDMVLNKGLDRVRFNRPVRVGEKVRAVADLTGAKVRPRDFIEATIAVTLEVGAQRPACTAQQKFLFHRAVSARSVPDSSL